MSDTAKELWEKLRVTRFSEALYDVAQRAIARAAQLERGIERANKSSAFIPDGVNLLQLIEELGNDK